MDETLITKKAEKVDGCKRPLERFVIPPLYQDEWTTIYQCDSLIAMPVLRPDVIITDPPYGIGAYANGTMGGGVLAKQSKFDKTDWDNKRPDRVYFEMMKHVSRNQVIFGGNYFADVLDPKMGWIVWDKDNGDNNFADCELAWTSYDQATRKVKFKWQGMLQENMKEKEHKYHPTQKPLCVLEWVIEKYTTPTDVILDPFLGSGTTLVAARRLGRKAIGIEINDKYCQIAIKRIKTIQMRLL